jgi:integrase
MNPDKIDFRGKIEELTMAKRHPDNERIKRRYFRDLKHIDGRAEQTIRQVEKAILRFEEFTHFADLKTFDQKQAIGFKTFMSDKDLAPATTFSTINAVKRFLAWLSAQPGYKSRVRKADIDYLNLPEKDIRAANAPADKKYPTLQMIETVVAQMPFETQIERRDRALIAFVAITGIRDGALISLKLKHLDCERRLVLQNPTEVATKFSKRIDTFLFPFSEAFEHIVLDWADYLRRDLMYADHDPLFPQTALGHDENDCFTPTGLLRKNWADASAVRKIFKEAFEAAGLPAFTPHSFRHMIVSEMYARKLSVAEFKAWSQNLGHEGAMTTLTSYGKLSVEEQGRLVRSSGNTTVEQPLTRSDMEDILRDRGL